MTTLPLWIWVAGVVVLGITLAQGILRNRTRTARERAITEEATKENYRQEDRSSKQRPTADWMRQIAETLDPGRSYFRHQVANSPCRLATQPACPATISGMNDADRFRKQAEDARQMAAKSVSPMDKATWLRIAEDWLRLAQDIDSREGKP